MESVEGRPALILVKVAQIIIADGRHLDKGCVSLHLLQESIMGAEQVVGRREAIAGRSQGLGEVTVEVGRLRVGDYVLTTAKNTITITILRGCHGR